MSSGRGLDLSWETGEKEETLQKSNHFLQRRISVFHRNVNNFSSFSLFPSYIFELSKGKSREDHLKVAAIL